MADNAPQIKKQMKINTSQKLILMADNASFKKK